MGGIMSDIEVLDKKDDRWYQTLVDDCRQNLVEAFTYSKWAVICAYHAVGSRILSEKKNFEGKGIYGENIVEKVAKSIGANRQYIFDAVRFAEKYPNLDMFPGDKSLSWNKVRQQYLISGEQKEKEKKIKRCPACGVELE